MCSKIESLYEINLSVVEKNIIHPILKKFLLYKKRKFGKHTVDYDVLVGMAGNEEILILHINNDIVTDEKPQEQDRVYRKNFKDLGQKQQIRRLNVIKNLLMSSARDEGLTCDEVLGFLLKCYGNSKIAKSYSDNLFQSSLSDKTKLSITTALAVYLDCNLGRSTYNKQRKLLSVNGFDIFPSWHSINEYQKNITPPIHHFKAPLEGVRFDFLQAFEMTTKRLVEITNFNSNKLEMKMKYGFDGSGSHAIYQQKNNSHTNNMILSVFCPLEVNSEDRNESWTELSPNIPNTQRPYMLQLGKESHETFQVQSPAQKYIKQLEDGVDIEGKEVTVQAFLTCDRKASDIFFGNGGAFCDLCTKTKSECEDIDIVKSGFEINKTVEQ